MALDDEMISEFPSVAILVLVKEYTKGFKESNFNLMKAIMELFLIMFEAHAKLKKAPELWICKASTRVAVEKIFDRKFSQLAPNVLTQLCVVRMPWTIISISLKSVDNIKSPLAHEALVKWFIGFCEDFGVATLGGNVKDFVKWLMKVSYRAKFDNKCLIDWLY